MNLNQMDMDSHLQRHQDLIRERANDRLAKQARGVTTKQNTFIVFLFSGLMQRVRQQLTRPADQPCPQPILRESDV